MATIESFKKKLDRVQDEISPVQKQFEKPLLPFVLKLYGMNEGGEKTKFPIRVLSNDKERREKIINDPAYKAWEKSPEGQSWKY